MVTKCCHHYYIVKYVMQKSTGVYSACLSVGAKWTLFNTVIFVGIIHNGDAKYNPKCDPPYK